MASEKREASPETSPLKPVAPKALPEDTSDVQFEDGIPLSPMAGDQQVQFISGNGDAKVEIGEGGAPTFVGLGKEELMKYANDPFWIKLRWFLFVLFWLLWIAMLVGAIVIIVLAPRCAEKKAVTETFYQMKGEDLVKEGKMDEHVKYLEELGIKSVILSDVLQHEPNNPEAVTNFEELYHEPGVGIEPGFFQEGLEKLKKTGITILLQFVPNHSGTKHEWFTNQATSDHYIRKPFSEVEKSVWVTQDSKKTAWSKDSNNATQAYLQQFSGNVADLNFRNDDVVSAFKQALSHWRSQNINGFVISKASYLVEDFSNLMNSNGTRNQPENVNIISRIVGTSSPGPNLVELDDPSDETIKQYIDKGLIPIIKSINTASADTIRQALEDLAENPKAIINLSKTSGSPAKSQLVNLLAAAIGSHTLISHETADPDKAFLKNVIKYQSENPRGKGAKIQFQTEDNTVVAALRADGDEHLIVANFGDNAKSFTPGGFNMTSDHKGHVVLVTPTASQRPGDTFSHEVTLNAMSGVIIKLAAKEESS